ncbi:MAG: hypothetical protein PHP97_03410 [Candidatus Shapirobacteria bacterium]|nr:hypothetical protein [Candidatus Shapirobacteria bacterium]MDD3003182.1 hypothetical protein [Candidatus Shapirobacteria bacterium]MDD4382812.1 hypothetical protein [Candidatus Shapirobacteria bacterium]
MNSQEKILEVIKKFQFEIVKTVVFGIKNSTGNLSDVSSQGNGDISYKIDSFAESKIDGLGKKIISLGYSVEITAEGIGKRKYLVSNNSTPDFAIIIDPIDGTRGIMYDFRSAFVLTGVAPYRPEGNTLNDIEIAVQTEIPTSKQDRISILWAIKNYGAYHQIFDLKTKKITNEPIKTSSEKNLDHGFAVFVNFFPGVKEKIGQIADLVFQKVQKNKEKKYSVIFDDQYISNAGQIYLMTTGKYRFVADIRPIFGELSGLTAHPYDLCTILIATEAGAIFTNLNGKNIDYPFDTDTKCGFIAYANQDLQNLIEPILLPLLK